MTDPNVVSISAAKLFLQKLLVAFVVGFVPIFLAGITTALQSLIDVLSKGGPIDFTFLKVLALSLISGAAFALMRAILAVSPVNLTASDKLHSLFQSKPTQVKAIGNAP